MLYEVITATAFFELNLITDNPNYSQIALNGNDLYLLDSSKSHLDTLNLSQKSHQNYSNDPSISNLTHIVSDQSGIYGLSSSDIQLISRITSYNVCYTKLLRYGQ